MSHKVLAVCLAGVLVSLLLVGIVSKTFVRHVIQVVPIGIVLMAIWRGSRVAPYFALPIFIVWGLVMVLIGLYLLGLQTFFSGSFSPAEVVLTVLIGVFSLAGIRACLRRGASPIWQRILAFALFTAIQTAAMWASFLPTFANR